MRILHGDCLAMLPTIADNSIDAIVTDAPYHLIQAKKACSKRGAYARITAGFMNQLWDGGDIAFRPDVWRECLRVLKPGGHMACFGGSRTHHRVWVAVEDAGFEIRDTLMWLYGSGFPKSRNVSKAIDVELGAARYKTGQGKAADGTYISTPGRDGAAAGGYNGGYGDIDHAAPATPEAEQWQGWGTALKPSHEPILLARKPLEGNTVAQNVLEHGTGALNIDASRVQGEFKSGWSASGSKASDNLSMSGPNYARDPKPDNPAGRWPPNLLHDGSEEVVECFPHTHHAGNTKPVAAKAGTSMFGIGEHEHNPAYYPGETDHSTARFFPHLGYSDDERRILYCPKAGKLDRAGSSHPTVKPIKLIEWLCKLICPPNGTILDPFAGSGTTGQAALNLGFDVIMIERETEYYNDIVARFQPTTIG